MSEPFLSPPESRTILEVAGLSKSFGSVRAADNVVLALRSGEALGIIGPNGAGKSSLFNLITGDLKPDAGEIRLNGVDITTKTPHERCRAGIARSYQIPQPFENLTVFENLLVGAVYGQDKREQEVVDFCAEILDRTNLMRRANAPAGSLTLLERKRLELARSLATNPQLLLLDEIAGGLTEVECQELIETIRGINASGTTIVWIEHVVHALLAVVRRLVVLNFGRKIAEGDPQTVMRSQEVREIYTGIEA
ncbi:MAG: ABC transporter ATP-binding protein [Xanthobacteraceae bacterium]